MGFFDSFSSGVSSFFGGIGDIATSFAGSPIGSSFLGDLGAFGLGELRNVIGLEPQSPGGSPRAGAPGTVFAPLGSPSNPFGFGPTPIPSFRPPPVGTGGFIDFDRLANLPGGVLNPVRRGGGPTPQRPSFAPLLPPVPASQPFGAFPGSEFSPLPVGGINMPAFPVSTAASFPGSPITNALFGGGGSPGFQQAGLSALVPSIARQLPSFLGGLAGGAVIDQFVGGGGGGGTPPFRATMQGARAQFFRTQNPATGQDVWFRPAGRPLLWSGDLTACKRVKKIARKASRKR